MNDVAELLQEWINVEGGIYCILFSKCEQYLISKISVCSCGSLYCLLKETIYSQIKIVFSAGHCVSKGMQGSEYYDSKRVQ
jgi:hypothetical protein